MAVHLGFRFFVRRPSSAGHGRKSLASMGFGPILDRIQCTRGTSPRELVGQMRAFIQVMMVCSTSSRSGSWWSSW
jgi:hypothetical protein